MLSALMTVYEEAEFVDYSIQSVLNYVDHLVIVEGAYLETVKLGKQKRSQDGTCTIIEKYHNHPKVFILYANEQSDPQQRNIGLNKIKELNSDGWMLIVDGDEVYDPNTFLLIKAALKKIEKENKKVAYFQSLTFVNDLQHYTLQKFPRLFKLTPNCTFVNDNYIKYDDSDLFGSHITELLNIKYYHYAFCKGSNRFSIKEKWWNTRFGKPFDYGWHINKDGKIEDKNHIIYEFKGNHPSIMKHHPKLKEC